MEMDLPSARSSRTPEERDIVKRIVTSRGLCGLANDTKWNELIAEMRSRESWWPSYRFQCVDGPPSGWDNGWFYHLPFPMISVEWLDIGFIQEIGIHRLPYRIESIDHSDWIEALLVRIGLDYQKGTSTIRIFGYSPRNVDDFDVPSASK